MALAVVFTAVTARAEGPRVLVTEVVLTEHARRDPAIGGAPYSGLLAEAVQRATGLETITARDIQSAVESAAQQQALGCDDLACAAELATLVKAELLLRTELGLLNGIVILNGTLINVAAGRVVQRHTLRVASAAELEEGIRRLAAGLFEPQAKAEGAGTGGTGDTGTGGTGAGSAAPAVKLDGRVLVMLRKASAELVDDAGKAALEQQVSATLGNDLGLTVVGREEVVDLLTREAELRALGVDKDEALPRIGEALNAPYAVSLNVGQAGRAVAVSASLFDTTKAEALGRSSLLLPDAAQLGEALDVAARNLFGMAAELPPRPGDESRFEVAMNALSAELHRAYEPVGRSALSRLAVLPLRERGAEARVRKLGGEVSGFVARKLQDDYKLLVTEQAKLDELLARQPLPADRPLSETERREIGMFLGASVLATGRVVDVGTDFLVETQLVRVDSGESLGSAHAFFPMGKADTLIKKAFVVRTKAGAIFRSFIPGWGQFYNGPDHHYKGGIVIGGFTLGIGGMVAGLLVRQHKLDKKLDWDPAHADEWARRGCDVDPSACIKRQGELDDEARDAQIGAFVSLGVALAFYLYGFIDAGVYAEDYSDVVYGDGE